MLGRCVIRLALTPVMVPLFVLDVLQPFDKGDDKGWPALILL